MTCRRASYPDLAGLCWPEPREKSKCSRFTRIFWRGCTWKWKRIITTSSSIANEQQICNFMLRCVGGRMLHPTSLTYAFSSAFYRTSFVYIPVVFANARGFLVKDSIYPWIVYYCNYSYQSNKTSSPSPGVGRFSRYQVIKGRMPWPCIQYIPLCILHGFWCHDAFSPLLTATVCIRACLPLALAAGDAHSAYPGFPPAGKVGAKGGDPARACACRDPCLALSVLPKVCRITFFLRTQLEVLSMYLSVWWVLLVGSCVLHAYPDARSNGCS
jgi:hypothetical protein